MRISLFVSFFFFVSSILPLWKEGRGAMEDDEQIIRNIEVEACIWSW